MNFKEFSQGYNGATGDSNKNVSALVSGLFLWRCPTAIPWFVIAIVIRISIDTCSFWRATHAAQECSIIVAPFFTHGYSAPPIKRVLWVFFVIAAALCLAPCAIFFGFVVSFAMCFLGFSARLFLKASAAFYHPKRELGSNCILFISAVAKTVPSYIFSLVRPLSFYKKSPKFLSSEIEFFHNGSMILP